jgi:hypothetical protein
MNPKVKFMVSYPPLRGIVQLANSNMLRFRNWSFTNKKGQFEKIALFIYVWRPHADSNRDYRRERSSQKPYFGILLSFLPHQNSLKPIKFRPDSRPKND